MVSNAFRLRIETHETVHMSERRRNCGCLLGLAPPQREVEDWAASVVHHWTVGPRARVVNVIFDKARSGIPRRGPANHGPTRREYDQPEPPRTSATDTETHSMRRPEIARLMTMRWISLVPSKMVKILASRCQRSTGYSRV
jgi:hypothetical protein